MAPRLCYRYTSGMPPTVHELRKAALDAVEARQALKAKQYAAEMRELAGLVTLYNGVGRDVVMEVAGTARMGQDAASGSLTRAVRQVELFPVALRLLEAGVMHVSTAHILLAVTKHASERVQLQVDLRVSNEVATLDAGNVREFVARTLVEVETALEAEESRERAARARANRGVWVKPVEDGMARIGAEVDGIAARKFELAFEEIVRAQKIVDDRNGVQRTQSQRRADVLAELPARYIALLTAQQRGQVDQLLAQARDDAAAALATEARAAAEAAAETAREAAAESATEAVVAPVVAEPSSAEPVVSDHAPTAVVPVPADSAQTTEELLCELLAVPVRQPVMLNVHSAATTLFGLDDRPCTVEGLGPWPGMEARMLLPDAALRRVLVDPETGIPIHVGKHLEPVVFYEPPGHGPPRPPDDGPPLGSPDPPPRPPGTSPEGSSPDATGPADDATDQAAQNQAAQNQAAREKAQAVVLRDRLARLLQDLALLPNPETQYVPSAPLRRLVQIRDQRCSGPGCSRKATACDLDHEVEYAEGGLTTDPNLGAKSRRCHLARHDGWDVVRDRRTGVTTWTSPLGRVYVRLPAWQPLSPVRAGAVLPLPRLEKRPEVPTDFPDGRTLRLSLSGPRPARETKDPDPRMTEPILPEPRSRPSRRDGGYSWDDGKPPPF